MKVVLDTNVLISGIFFTASAPPPLLLPAVCFASRHRFVTPPTLRSRLGLALSVLPVLGGGILTPLLAQVPETPRGSRADETVRVRLVQLAITARDRGGNPVTDLIADEIVVKERGRKMRVAFLEPFSKEHRAEEVPDVRLYVGAPGAAASTVRSEALEPRHVILFIDVENDYRLLKQEAVEEVLRFLRDELGPEYRGSVVAYDGEFHVESGFTKSRDELASAVMRAFDRPPRPRLDLQARVPREQQVIKHAIQSTHVSIPADVGAEQMFQAAAVEIVQQIVQVSRGGFGPAMNPREGYAVPVELDIQGRDQPVRAE